ncbi:hypothetical protein HYU95_06105 [Candidatus Daviesbacteria bacterium]|nr:hypothetical protein [Candidatus Daviesbacteria bacterium]
MERIRKVPPLIKELKTFGFDIRVMRHQSNGVVERVIAETLRNIEPKSTVQIITQEGLQFPPSTIYLASRDGFRVLIADSETSDPVHTSQEIHVIPPLE